MFNAKQAMTFDNANQALDEGLRAIEAGATTIDLAGVGAVDSSAIAVLLAWQRAALARATPLTLANPSVNLYNLAQVYGVATLLQLAVTGAERADLPHH